MGRGGGGNGSMGLVQVHGEGEKGYWGGEVVVCWLFGGIGG